MIFNLKSDHGFTLVELLVVISVISILSNISIIQYKEYVEKIRDKEQEFLTRQVEKVLSSIDEPEDVMVGISPHLAPNAYALTFDSSRGPSDIRKFFNRTSAYFDLMQIPPDTLLGGVLYRENTGRIIRAIEVTRCTNMKTNISFLDNDGTVNFYSMYNYLIVQCDEWWPH